MAAIPSGQLEIINGPVIEAGESLSDAIEIGKGHLVRLTMPAVWGGEPITLQISTDGEGFNDLFYADGHEVTVVGTPGAAVLVPEALSRVLGFIRLRSGTRDKPVPQMERREFAMTVSTAQPSEIETLPRKRPKTKKRR